MAKSAQEVGFVHLHLHSSYSLLEGALKVPQLAELAKADGQPALALTDTGNLFGALEFSQKMEAAGIQPIVGCSLAVNFGDEPPTRNGAVQRLPRIVLLAATEQGYRELMLLVSKSHLDTAESAEAHVTVEWLKEHAAGVIALTGGPEGPIDKAIVADRMDIAQSRLATLADIFGNRLYNELQRHNLQSERVAEAGLIELAYAL
jgi:DNA polymerase-3 subunit alpha